MEMFNEDDAIAYIRSHIDLAVAELYDDDDLLNIIDMIFDYYESNGMLDIDDDEDDDPAELREAVTDYCSRMLRKDRDAHMDPAHLGPIVAAELDYENSL